MAKTGDSYTTARAMLLRAEAPKGTTELKLATSGEKIRRRTGHGWEEWFAMLDEWAAANRPHREIAAAQLGIEPLAWPRRSPQATRQPITAQPAIGTRSRRRDDHPDGRDRHQRDPDRR